MTVTGRTYRITRPRGFAEWRPQERTKPLLKSVLMILDEYQSQLPLTLRQIFYILVGRHGYEKTEKAYNNLAEMCNRARRGRCIRMDAIRDDGTSVKEAPGFYGMEDFWDRVRATADIYVHHLADGQQVAVEVWVEAAGMVPQAAQVASQYGVDVWSSGGFDSVTAKYEAAVRIAGYNRPTVVLHIGDHDPSGCSIIDSAAEDICAFVASMRVDPPEFRRIAVTEAQIAHYKLVAAPQKATDNRGERMNATVQAEALPPDVLADELRAELDAVTDPDALADMRHAGNTERSEIIAMLTVGSSA